MGWKKKTGLRYTLREKGLAKTINHYPHYFTFTFVRNPFDRFVSIWKHSERGLRNAEPNGRNRVDKLISFFLLGKTKKAKLREAKTYFYRTQRGLSLKEYAYLIREGDQKKLSCFDSYHSKKQIDFVLDFNMDTYMSIPRKIRKKCDFIGQVENINEDFKTVCNLLNIPFSILPHKNQNKDSIYYSKHYDKETLNLVREIYKKDFEAFGYNLEL